MNHNVLAVKSTAEVVNIPLVIDKGDFCWCKYYCLNYSYAFAGNDNKTNDKSSFIFRRISPSDTVTMKLFKNGVETVTLVDNTYGTFYNFGSLANADLKGYLIDWGLVQTALGSGDYQFKATSVLLGTTIEYESIIFKVIPYNEAAADNTVRIESYQNGKVDRSPFDFTGVNWYSQYRLYGNMRNKQPEFTTNSFQDSTRTTKQNQSTITNTYDLVLPDLDENLKDTFVEEVMLANDIIITDYNIDNNDRYEPIPVYPKDIDSLDYHVGKPNANLVIKFSDKKPNIIKRNSF